MAAIRAACDPAPGGAIAITLSPYRAVSSSAIREASALAPQMMT
jgi:hypothetical protein